MHRPTEKMLPIGLFLCFAVLTVHSKNYDIPSTLHEKYNFASSQQDLKLDQFIFGLQPRYRAHMLGDGLLTKGGLCM